MSHFPNIYQRCKEEGYDVTKECIPVVPAQHYFMGGIKVNHSSATSMANLYAVGETACNGVHGRNRLASNSLLESLVFAKRAAAKMKEDGFSYDENAACVEVVQSLTLYAGRFPKDSYADYRTFARSVSRSYDGKIILVKKQ